LKINLPTFIHLENQNSLSPNELPVDDLKQGTGNSFCLEPGRLMT